MAVTPKTTTKKATTTKAKTTAKTTSTKAKVDVVNKEVKDTKKTTTKSTKPVVKKRLKLADDVLIAVKSNVFGRLTYINHKTGDETRWENFGEVQPLSVGDLRAMKAKQLSFFKENWITIDGIEEADEEFDDVEVDEIYDALQISKYYSNFLCPDNINEIFNWSVADIKNKIPRMTKSVQESIVVRANELIKEGILDSISKVKALEEVLGCELATYED